jgi:hypothetical protein
MALALAAGVVASLAVPGGKPQRAHRVDLTKPRVSLE